jgi:putative selenate reductase
MDGSEIPSVRMRRDGDAWIRRDLPPVATVQRHQIANFADFCNDCGNCDVFCPEDGGPYVLKPRFFGSRAAFSADGRDGFFVGRGDGETDVHGRFGTTEVRALFRDDGTAVYSGASFRVELDRSAPEESIRGQAEGDVDLTWFRILDRLQDALLGEGRLTWPGVVARTRRDD